MRRAERDGRAGIGQGGCQRVVVLRRERRRIGERDAHPPYSTARVLVRTWNVFHGNSKPPERRAFLEEMVRLAVADEPDLVCLQEVPAWAVAELDDWSGY